jgi:Ser/Thr protein kinase RdoA (MazF antagonist)
VPNELELIQRVLDAEGRGALARGATSLTTFENDVYLVETSDPAQDPSVVRISRPGARTLSEVRAELDFVRFLAAAGVDVAQPLGEAVPLDDRVGARFRYVPGSQVSQAEHADGPTAFELGRVMGLMHRVAGDLPADVAEARPVWTEAASLRLDVLEAVARRGMLAEIRAYVRHVGEQAGELLVHGDLALGNVILTSPMTVIDFDDACRAEPEFDFAVVLIRLFTMGDATGEDVERLVPQLVAGYRSGFSRPLDPDRLDHYARILLLQSAVAASLHPGCPGLTAPDAMARAWAAIGGRRTLPELLGLAVARAGAAG